MTDFHVTPEEAESGIGDPARRAAAVQVENRLAAGEIIAGYCIPVRAGERSAYIKVRERESYEYALVAAAATVSLDKGKIRAARLALGSVALKPWRLRKAEAALTGMRLEREPVLAAIRDVFGAIGWDRLQLQQIVEALHAMEAAGWDEWRGEQGDQRPHKITKAEISHILRARFRVQSRSVWPPPPRRPEHKSGKGYWRQDLEPLWAAYCPSAGTAAQGGPRPPLRVIDGTSEE